MYLISGVKCHLEMDHTLKETMEIEAILGRAGTIVMQEAEKLLELILKPQKPVEFLDMKESQLTEIVTDYLLLKKKWRENMIGECLKLASDQSGLNQKLDASVKDKITT